MMSRRKSSIFLLASLVFIFGQGAINAATTAKAGGTCTKAGATSIVSGKIFTCVKSGKKLVWDKGVVIPKANPTPQPTTSTQTPVAPTPSTPTQNSPTTSSVIDLGGSCTKEGDIQTLSLNPGQVICQSGKWSPYNSSQSPSSPVQNGNSSSGPIVATEWTYLYALTSGNGLGNVSDASLVQEPSGKIRMYFKNGNSPEAKISGMDNYIHSAVSTDNGLTWTVESGVRMAVTSPVEVLPKAGGGYQAWGWKHTPSGDSMYYAESSDGLTFTEISIPGLDATTCKTSSGQSIAPLGDPAIVKLADGTWLLHAQGFGVGDAPPTFARWACVATSPDGKTWTAIQSRSYGGSPDVETNPNIYVNKDGKVEWFWPSPTGIVAKIGDGSTFGSSTTYIKGGDPERLDLANGTELLAIGGFDSRMGGVIIIAKRVKTNYSITHLSSPPTGTSASPNSTLLWSISGATESQVTVWNFCLNKNVKDISGATVTFETTSGTLKVTARDPANAHSCTYVLVGSEKVIG